MLMNQESLPCIVCRKMTYRAFEGGYELQPEDALHFSTDGAYGTTVFDPMDCSTLDVVICDECIQKAGRDGIVRLSQPRIGIVMQEDGMVAGYYSPEREPVVWDPDKRYPDQQPIQVSYEEVGTHLTDSVMWSGSAIERARDRLRASDKSKD